MRSFQYFNIFPFLGQTIQLQRITDENFIPLRLDNIKIDTVPAAYLNNGFFVLSKEEADRELQDISGKKLTVYYQIIGESECSILGIMPDGKLDEVFLYSIFE